MLARSICISMMAFFAAPAQSSGRAIMDTSGVAFTHLADIDAATVPAEFNGSADGVGFKYAWWGIFFVDFWRSDGEYCIHKGGQYHVISRTEAAALLGVPENELAAPFLYRFPPGFIGLGLVVLCGIFWAVALRTNRTPADPIGQSYRLALEIYRETMRKNEERRADAKARNEFADEADPWDAALAVLMAAGIDKTEAEDNFSKMLADAIASPPGPD